MRLSFYSSPALAAAFCLVASMAVCHAENFPYRASTISETTEVRGGPGDNFAATLELPPGTVVEVYRHDPGGWCAIRPPEGSFSLIFARHVDPLDGGLGQINKDDVPARVGSTLRDMSDVVQLRLKKDAVVEILDEINDGNETWYKIAPPAGEFRWVHASDLQQGEPTIAAESAQPVQNGANQVILTSGEEAAWEASAGPQSATAANPNKASISPARVVAPPLATNTPQSSSAVPAGNISQDLAVSLEALEIQLSQMVAQDRSTWQIQPFEAEAERLLALAMTVDERAAVKRVLEKIDRFSTVQRRFALTGQPATAGIAATGMPYQGRAGMPQASVPPANVASASQYDAVGVLRPVVSRRPGAPRYAIVDEQGEILSFITPTPDMNLQPYLGHKIAVRGNRPYLPQSQPGAATAGRVMPLQPSQRDLVR